LLETAAELPSLPWSKSYYEPAQKELLSLVPESTKSLLSIGCGWGAVEGHLVQNGIEVVAVPLDSVISTCAEARGVRTVTADFEKARRELSTKRFDCILISNVLHFLRDPLPILTSYSELLSQGGSMIVSVPNFKYLKILWRRIRRRRGYTNLGSYDKSGVNLTNHRNVRDWLKSCELVVDSTFNVLPERLRSLPNFQFDIMAPALAPGFIVRARKHASTKEHLQSDAFSGKGAAVTDVERREVFQ
jgi:SAM-dependent methyltransferase